MYTEKTKLTDKRDSPLFYGSYREKSALEELHWKNQKKKRQLCIVTATIISLTLLSIGIILAITLPPVLDDNSKEILDPLDPIELLVRSTSVLNQYDHAGVSSEHTTCSEIGNSILETRNGSAVDSAVAVAFCLGVMSPQSCGLGGGFFMTIYSGRKMYSLNARETAPELVNEQTFLDNPTAAISGGLSVGIPGEIAGLYTAHQRFGRIPWAEVVGPARDLAQNGFPVSRELGRSLKNSEARISKDEVLRSEFFNAATGAPWIEGDIITRPRLAKTLESLVQLGGSEFYNGTLAQNIVQEISEAGGVITMEDLASYSAEWVESIVYTFQNNLTMFSLPFPSSGPIAAMALGVLEGYGKKNPAEFSPQENGIDAHRLIETLKFAAAHRSQIGDPNFGEDDDDSLTQLMNKLLSPEYATEIRGKIFDYQTFSDPAYYGNVFEEPQESGTAHISIIGPDGDAVSLTTTINSPFGAGFMGNLTGIIYNNEIADFSFPNISSKQGLPANPRNFVEPGKQPASSMAPLIFLNSVGQPVLATGGAGGLKILPAVIAATWRALYRESDIKAAIDYPRFSPKFNPTEVEYEYGLPASLIDDLQRKGHETRRISLDKFLGNVNSVCRTKRTAKILANADYRKTGGSAGF